MEMQHIHINTPALSQYLTLVAELGVADVQLLKLLLQFVEIGLQPRVLQLDLVQLTLELLVISCQQLVVVKKLTVRLIQPCGKKNPNPKQHDCRMSLVVYG